MSRGFDADRRHPLHDALCAYHADPEVARALVTSLLPDETERDLKPGDLNHDKSWFVSRFKLDGSNITAVRFAGTLERSVTEDDVWPTLETAVYADRGRWKQMIGHLDVYVGFCRTTTYRGTLQWIDEPHRRDPAKGPYSCLLDEKGLVIRDRIEQNRDVSWNDNKFHSLAVEVKARITSLGELVRQITRYREEWRDYVAAGGSEIERPRWWVVSSPGMTEGLRQILKAQDIIGIKPGSKFLGWCADHGLALPPDARRIVQGPDQLSLES